MTNSRFRITRWALPTCVVAVTVILMAAVALAGTGMPPTTADVHKEAGLDCDACHASEPKGEVSMDVCLGCHGSYADLAKATSGLGMNPHDSHYIDPDCNLCHHGHTRNEDFCAGCHQPTTTADKHMVAGVGCSSCHDKNPDGTRSNEVETERCLSCHGSYEELAKKTSDLPLNPHRSHYVDLDCSVCHKGHTQDEDFCATCHN